MDSMNEVEKKIEKVVDYAMDADFGGEGAMKMIGFNRRDYIVAELASLIQEERQGAVEKLLDDTGLLDYLEMYAEDGKLQNMSDVLGTIMVYFKSLEDKDKEGK